MNTLIHYSFITLVFGVCSCTPTDSSPEKKAYPFPTVLDTSSMTSIKNEFSWLNTVKFHPVYIGPKKDTVLVNYELGEQIDTMKSYYLDSETYHEHPDFFQAKLRIEVDTSQRIKNKMDRYQFRNLYFDAYPVLIEALIDDTVAIGFGEYLFLTTEALDSLGNWRVIEKDWRYFCGYGIGPIILPPDHIVLSATTIQHGNYATRLRLKLGNQYSNEFPGFIHYRQFEKKSNANGRYKKEYIEDSQEYE